MENGRTMFSCTCEKCGRTLYEGEILNIKGKYVCELCAEKCVFGDYSAPRGKKKVPSAFFHFVFSFHPGAGQMYLGLMKRGLFQMCLFYLCIYLLSTVMPVFFGLLIPIICIYSFFDSLSLRRKMVDGEEVFDELGGLAEFLRNYKVLIVLALIAMLVIGLISSAFDFISDVYLSRREEYTPQSVEIYIDEAVGAAVHNSVSSIASGRRGPVMGRVTTFGLASPLLLIALGGLIILKCGKNCKRSKAKPAIKPDDIYDVYDSNE